MSDNPSNSLSNPTPAEQASTLQTQASEAVQVGSATAEPSFGWTPYAEQINGRFAMVGFALLLIFQWFTRQDLFTWLGF